MNHFATHNSERTPFGSVFVPTHPFVLRRFEPATNSISNLPDFRIRSVLRFASKPKIELPIVQLVLIAMVDARHIWISKEESVKSLTLAIGQDTKGVPTAITRQDSNVLHQLQILFIDQREAPASGKQYEGTPLACGCFQGFQQ